MIQTTTVRWTPRAGVLTFHRGLRETHKVWSVERREGFGWITQYVVRCYEHDVLVSQEECTTEAVARKIFERKVEASYK